MKPANLESEGRAEGFASVEIRATCFIEATRDLGETENDYKNTDAGDENRERTPRTGKTGYCRREAEDTAADYAVDHGSSKGPAAYCPNQRRPVYACFNFSRSRVHARMSGMIIRNANEERRKTLHVSNDFFLAAHVSGQQHS